jgi:peptidoglycan hydrolase CwlO-like protein
MRNKIGTFLVLAAVCLVSWIFLSLGSGETEEKTLRMQVTLDSLRNVNHDQKLYIMQLEYEVESLEYEVEDLQDQISECTEDFQNCIAGRKIQIRHIDGNILTSNPEY